MQPLAPRRGNVFSGVPLDRAALLRKDEGWLAARLGDPASRFIPVWQQQNVVLNGAEPRAAFYSRASLGELIDGGATTALLGVPAEPHNGEAAHFAVDVSAIAEAELLAHAPKATLMDLRQLVQIVPADEAALLAYARGILYWHARHRHCGVCGAVTASIQAGHERLCTDKACAAVHFPRTDAAIIVLVHDGEHCLLSRQTIWPKGMHSTLAGFLEPGESLEEAVAREVFEESGIVVADVRYHSSQPWPFPSALMVGFMARAVGGTLTVNTDELESADWYRRADLQNRTDDDSFRMPGAYSIARHLIEDWLDGRLLG